MSWIDLEKRLKEKTVKRHGNRCWPFLGYRDKEGNGRIWVSRKIGTITVQRAIKVLELGKIPEGFVPLGCPILKDCCNPDHISLATSEEIADRILWKKRQKRRKTAQPFQRKLTDEQVRRIYLAGDPVADIAAELGVSKDFIHKVRRNLKYQRVTKGLKDADKDVWSESSGRMLTGDDASYCGYGYVEYDA